MIYITGDLHGTHDIHKLSTSVFSQQKAMTRSDYVIICGDFGLVWNNDKEDLWWRRWLNDKPWTTLWIDGNHENFDLLEQFPLEEWNGGRVHRITDNILHLCRGSVFTLEGKKFFAFGGAESHDKEYRTYGRSMWKQELPSAEEMETGRRALAAAGWQVDVVLSHSLPQRIQGELYEEQFYPANCLTEYFDEISERLDYRLWFSGHYHTSRQYDDRHFLIYNDIIRLTDGGFARIWPSAENAKFTRSTLPEIYEGDK